MNNARSCQAKATYSLAIKAGCFFKCHQITYMLTTTTGNWQAIYVDSANSTWNYWRKDRILWWRNTTHTTIKSEEKLKTFISEQCEPRKRDTWRKKKEMQGAKRKKSYMTWRWGKKITKRRNAKLPSSTRLWVQGCFSSSSCQKIYTFGSSLCCVKMAENCAWHDDCRGRHWKKNERTLLWNNRRS